MGEIDRIAAGIPEDPEAPSSEYGGGGEREWVGESERFKIAKVYDSKDAIRYSRGTKLNLSDPKMAQHYLDRWGHIYFVFTKAGAKLALHSVYHPDESNFRDVHDSEMMQPSRELAELFMDVDPEEANKFLDNYESKRGSQAQPALPPKRQQQHLESLSDSKTIID